MREAFQKMKKTNICILVISSQGGGAEKSMGTLYSHLPKHKFNVSKIAINKTFEKSNVEDFQLNRANNARLFETFFALIRFQFLLLKIKPAVMIINCELSELFGALALNPFVKLIVIQHCEQPWSNNRKLGVIIRFILRSRKATWVKVSDHINLNFPQDSRICKIPNAIEFEVPKFHNHFMRKSQNISRIIFIGRLHPEKNPLLILQAASKLELPVVFLGEGVSKSNLARESVRLCVDAKFPGFVKKPFQYFNENDLLVVPSITEGDGLVLYEALLHRVPFLVSDISAFRISGISNIHFFQNLENCVELIAKYDISNFVEPEGSRNEILKTRIPRNVVYQWDSLISSLVAH